MDDTKKLTGFGPGLEQERLPVGHSLIEGFDDYKFVEILNPLPGDFHGKVGMTRSIPAKKAKVNIGSGEDLDQWSEVTDERSVRSMYGIDLRNKMSDNGKMHIRQDIVIPAGQTKKLFGSEAQVVAMQLVTAIIQFEGSGSIADPALREAAEARVIRSTGDIRQTMATIPQSERDQLQVALDQMNDNVIPANTTGTSHEEAEFGGILGGDSGQGNQSQPTVDEPRKRIGRPPKTA